MEGERIIFVWLMTAWSLLCAFSPSLEPNKSFMICPLHQNWNILLQIKIACLKFNFCDTPQDRRRVLTRLPRRLVCYRSRSSSLHFSPGSATPGWGPVSETKHLPADPFSNPPSYSPTPPAVQTRLAVCWSYCDQQRKKSCHVVVLFFQWRPMILLFVLTWQCNLLVLTKMPW